MGALFTLLPLVFNPAPKYNTVVECANCRAEIPESRDTCPACGWQAPAERMHFAKLNGIFSGRYDFLRLLGIGGFAEVYLARDVLLERDVAIKILLPQHAQDAQTVERFLREARLYAKLEHPNIIPIYDTGVLQGNVFITMKYIRGESLKHVLSKQERIAPRLLPNILRGVAQALAYIHQQGIVHRDIKPANIIVEKTTDAVYLADFGIARAESSQTLTQTGMIVGTPHYLSPEQIQGRKIDQRSDIYALGATLYELAAGRPPFLGDSPLEILYQHINESPTALVKLVEGIDPLLERIISRCIEKDPERRFQKAEEIIAMLDRAARPRPPAAERTTLIPPPPPGRGKGTWALAGAALLVSAAIAAYFLWLRPARPAPTVIEQQAPVQTERAAGGKQKPAGTILPSSTAPIGVKSTSVPLGEAEPPGQGPGEKIQGRKETATHETPAKAGSPGPETKPVQAAAPLPGIIRFSSFPPLADVFLKGEKIGNTEQVFQKTFPPGEYVFSFTIPDYRSEEVRVSLAAGETVEAHRRFPEFRTLTVNARPWGRIQIDGKDHGDTPKTVKLSYGEHLVRITKEGYRSEERRVTIDRGAKNLLFFELAKEEKK